MNRWNALCLSVMLGSFALRSGVAGEPAETAARGREPSRLAEDLPEAVTYAEHVAPILQASCQPCHRPGQVGPFSLLGYEKAKGWAAMIEEVLREDRMPPWNADREFDGVFANERRLGERDKELVLKWIADGMPRGNPEADPQPVKWPEGWTIGHPHAVVTVENKVEIGRDGVVETPLDERGWEVPREGVVEYQYFSAQTDFASDMWVRAIETRPGVPDVVHHVLVWVDDPEDPGGWQEQDSFRSYFAVTVPGETPSVYPAGLAKRLPAGAKLIFQVHYTPNGKERFDKSSLAMIFSDEPPEREVYTDAVVNTRFRVPAGADDVEVRALGRIERDIELLTLFPHMHTRGKDFRFVLRLPDGAERDLLRTRFDFNWQEAYAFAEPVLLPGGSELHCVGHFDNSAANPNNPDPSVEVRWGDQTFDEMFIGYYDYIEAR